MTSKNRKLIETDRFPFEFLSLIGERESWRKEVHRPIYHVHKWWAKRLGSVFRGILLGCTLEDSSDLQAEFYRTHEAADQVVLDPFMGSGTTVGEAHKLGLSALGRDINPVAVNAVRVALGPLDRRRLQSAFRELSDSVGVTIRSLYKTTDSRGRSADVLYYFWVMQAPCPQCNAAVDLFSSYVVARNARPQRKPEVQIVCPGCGTWFAGRYGERTATCPCGHSFDPERGPANGAKATCRQCSNEFRILTALGGERPSYRLYGKLVLTADENKEYLATSADDHAAFAACSQKLKSSDNHVPTLCLAHGFNTRQAIGYGFTRWRDFFNDRQLLALGLLRSAILEIECESTRSALFALFSGVLEFNNLFASYKGEGTGAVRHMFSHHILKPERTPIEANLWGTRKSSGSFSNLFRSRLLRAIDYREAPTEVNGTGNAAGKVCSPAFSGELASWGYLENRRSIAISCGSSATLELPDQSIDLIVTDPPFFDNVHYSELADFFFAWTDFRDSKGTRRTAEVQDSDSDKFAQKLKAVFIECARVLRDTGLLVFTYHHSRDEGWQSLADAVLGAGFTFVNSHPVKAEMSVATPKSQAKEPIQLDIILVCRKGQPASVPSTETDALQVGRDKISRLEDAGFRLSLNDRKIILFGQLLTTLTTSQDTTHIANRVLTELNSIPLRTRSEATTMRPKRRERQGVLFPE